MNTLLLYTILIMNINEKHNNTQIDLPVNKSVEVTLESYPGTGYSWYAKTNILFKLEDKGYDKQHQIFKFTPQKRGDGLIELEYKRIWEKKEPLKVFKVKVHIL